MHPASPGREVCSDSLLPGLLHPKKNCVGCGKGMWLLLETKHRQAGRSGTRQREQLHVGQRAPEWTQGLAPAVPWLLRLMLVSAADRHEPLI